VVGLSDPSVATCNGSTNSTNINDTGYTCKPGYYKKAGPAYCVGVLAMDAVLVDDPKKLRL
jgi:hypothetical protein